MNLYMPGMTLRFRAAGDQVAEGVVEEMRETSPGNFLFTVEVTAPMEIAGRLVKVSPADLLPPALPALVTHAREVEEMTMMVGNALDRLLGTQTPPEMPLFGARVVPYLPGYLAVVLPSGERYTVTLSKMPDYGAQQGQEG